MERRGGSGIGLAVLAYLCWGLFPLYWPLLAPAGPDEQLAHRMIWSLVFVLGVVLLRRRFWVVRDILRDRRRLGMLTAAAVLIAINWYVYILGVTTDRVVETSLGYFINPLVTVLLGVVVLRERMRVLQWVAVGVAAAAVVVLTIDYGRPPWIALVLAATFSTYGLLKKRVDVDATEGLTVESAVLFLPAVGYLGWLEASGQAAFLHHGGVGYHALLVGAGVVTAIPLLLFAGASRRVPLVTIGLLQYLTPVIQFLIGVALRGEPMTTARWAGFVVIWVALVIFTVDQLVRWRRREASVEPTSS